MARCRRSAGAFVVVFAARALLFVGVDAAVNVAASGLLLPGMLLTLPFWLLLLLLLLWRLLVLLLQLLLSPFAAIFTVAAAVDVAAVDHTAFSCRLVVAVASCGH